MTVRPDLIANRYDGLPVGPSLFYSFETQEGIPVDGSRPELREKSPFTISIIPPELGSGTVSQEGSDVDIYSRARESLVDQERAANAVRNLFGASSVSGTEAASLRLAGLQQIVSAGQEIQLATSNTERAVLVDQYTAADILYQVELMLQVPPLTLLINPNELSISYTSVQKFSDASREGFIFERWGESQPSMSISGSTGGYIAGADPLQANPLLTETSTPTGLQFASRPNSAAWQNFMSLYHFYRNNGYIYDTVRGSRAHLMIGAIAIDYDGWRWVGHFEDFDFTESEDQPHRMEYSMTFTIDRIFDNSGQSLTVTPYQGTSSPSTVAARPSALGGGIGGNGSQPLLGQVPLDLIPG
jgi:hypothetical protein